VVKHISSLKLSFFSFFFIGERERYIPIYPIYLPIPRNVISKKKKERKVFYSCYAMQSYKNKFVEAKMQFYKEERMAVAHLTKIYKHLKERGIEKEEVTRARMCIDLMKNFGRSERWCEKQIEILERGKGFDDKEEKKDLFNLDIAAFGEAVDDKPPTE
jgi:hypothetical protein